MTTQLTKVKYDVISDPLAGEIVCGDQYLVKELTDSVLLAVIDGLGHGEEAAFAAKCAVQTLADYAHESIRTLFELCNQALHPTRGAAMTVMKIDANYKMKYIAVGNVMGVCLIRTENGLLKRESTFQEGGIVGNRLPHSLLEKEIVLSRGDIIILATDGINPSFEVEEQQLQTPENIVRHTFTQFRNEKDDALVLAAQLL